MHNNNELDRFFDNVKSDDSSKVAQSSAAHLLTQNRGRDITFDVFMDALRGRAGDWKWESREQNNRLDISFTTHSPFSLDLSLPEVAAWMRDAHADGWTVEPLSCLVAEVLIDLKLARTALDIGTHFGFISMFLLRHPALSMVHGIEMNPGAVAAVEQHLALPQNSAMEPARRYQMHQCALSDKDSPQCEVWYSGMRLSFDPHPRFTRSRMDVRSLASICREIGEVPDFLKIDIEGYEGRLLHDLAWCIDEGRPTVLLELHWDEIVEANGATRAEIMNLFLSRGYRAARLNWHQKMPRRNFANEVTKENVEQLLREKNHAMYAFF